ncbi:hypothetical protein RHGRI_017465 [Rhododendron griersonianum]|uniref:Uncharacterized protein n=1 Tax=Rhododendron griersonianum TaxID=479676 RepID=A0AAV6JXX6_9ERIC|nr:hypothetical protein RHGRI_017465 [Rhododendron griersonianum]
MGTNIYPSSALLEQHKDESIRALPVDELIEKADGFAGVFPVLTEPGLSVIISAVLTSQAIFQTMKNYTIYAVSITIRIVVLNAFSLLGTSGYLAMMTVISFWAAYRTDFFPIPCLLLISPSLYMYSYAEISQLKFNVHTISADNSTETTNRSEALLALPPNTPNKKSKKGDHNSSTSTSGPVIDTPANSNPTTNSPTTEETPDSHSKNK